MIKNFTGFPNYNLVRFVACFLVVLHHVIAYFETQKGLSFPMLTIVSSTCVPLFILLSGALLIPKNENCKVFYSKRIKSVFIPFLFWIAFYTLFRLLSPYLNNAESTILIYKNLIGIGGWPYYHLWYIYLILFLYLITPAIRKLLKLFPVQYSLFMSLFLVIIFWFIALNFNDVLFSNYIAFYIMGGVIGKVFNKKKAFFKMLFFMLVLLLLGIYQNLDTLVATSFSILFFLVFIKLPYRAAWIDVLIPLTLGIYLVHPLVLKIVAKVLPLQKNLLFLTILIFLVTAVIVFLTKKNKYLKKIY